MGLLERWDERNQRTVDRHREVARRSPSPTYAGSTGRLLAGMFALDLISFLLIPLIGFGPWIAIMGAFTIVLRSRHSPADASET